MSVTVELSELDADLWDAFRRGGEWVAASEYRKLMAQNAKLREDVDRLIQAVEDLHDVSLEDRLVQLENENDKLRKERDRLLMNASPTANELRRVRAAWEKDRAENAKLRGLVRDWYELAVGGADSLTDWNHAQADLEQRMRELGIEVDE